MGKMMLMLLLLAPAAIFATASPSEVEDDVSSVIVLDDANFDYSTAGGGTWLLEFYAPWCGHCKKLAPVYEKGAKAAEKYGLMMAKVDCTVNKALQARFEIKSFPTIKVWRDGVVGPYKGRRTVEGFAHFAFTVSQPPLARLPSKDLQRLKETEALSFVFVGPDSPERGFVQHLAAELQVSLLKFVWARNSKNDPNKPSKKALAALGLKNAQLPALVAVCQECDNDRFHGDTEAWEHSLRDWVKQHRLPPVSQLSGANFDDVTTDAGKIAILAVIDPADTQANADFHEHFLVTAKRHMRTYAFAELDGVRFAHYLKQFGLEPTFPTVFALDAPAEHYYKLPLGEGAPDDGTSFSQHFVNEMLAGNLPATHQLPWTRPARWFRELEKRVEHLSTPVLVGVITVVLGLSAALLIWVLTRFDGPPAEQTDDKDSDKKGKKKQKSGSKKGEKKDKGGIRKRAVKQAS